MVENIIKFLVAIVRAFVNYSRFSRIENIFQRFYSVWLSQEFKSSGKGASFGFPLFIRGGRYISIGQNVCVGRRGVLAAWDRYMGKMFSPEIVLMEGVSIGEDCHITAICRIEIHENVLIGKKVTITDNSHGRVDEESLKIPPRDRELVTKGGVIIEKNVWIGDKVTILPGVTVGQSSIIGANSVVTKDVPPFTVVAGCPGTVIKNLQGKQ